LNTVAPGNREQIVNIALVVTLSSSCRSINMPVEVAFEKLDDEITLPLFRPARR
jgi:hypothetical protein